MKKIIILAMIMLPIVILLVAFAFFRFSTVYYTAKEAAVAAEKEAAAAKKVSTTAAPVDYPLCAEGDYDFSSWDINKAGKVETTFRQDCYSKITLPMNVCWRTHPSVDVEVVWSDGSKYIDGPNRLTPGINGKRLFVIKGLRESGTLQISFEKQI